MNPSEIMKALEMVLTERDFQILVRESDSLLCTRDGQQYRIQRFKEGTPATGGNPQEIRILLAPEEMMEEKKGLFAENILLWSVEDLEREVGRIALAAQGIDSGTSSTFLDRLLPDEGGVRVKSEPVVSAFLSPVIDEGMAKTISEETIKGFNFEMEYIPHYIYIYSMVMTDEGGESRRKEGEIWMNAVSGDFIEPLQESELLPSESMETERLVEPEIDSDDALEHAKKRVLEFREEEKEAITEVPGALAINRKTFLPVADSLVLSFRGTVYLPVWSIEGIHGSIIIDAVKGELVSEIFFEEQENVEEDDAIEKSKMPGGD